MRDLDRQLAKALRKQRKRFIRKFGREPGPEDPVFFDPDADTPQPMDERRATEDITDALAKAGAPPEVIYVFRKLGLLVGPETIDRLSETDRLEYEAAIVEFRAMERQQAKAVRQ